METLQEALKHLPQSPGVYVYRDKTGTVIYVGKAVNLRRRVKQYFSGREAIGEKTDLLVSQIATLETMKTPGEFDALLLEASLIRKYLPKYNVISRDDKSPLYIVLTLDEKLPHVLFLRKSDIPKSIPKRRRVFGPFQSARTARSLMRSLRRIIPYCLQSQRNGRPCFYTHLHLCNPCPSVIAKMPDGPERIEKTKLYRNHMKVLSEVLSGKSHSVLRAFEKEMEFLASYHKYEEANAVKHQLQGLYDLVTRRFDVRAYLENSNYTEELENKELDSLLEILRQYYPEIQSLTRIECIDIANIAGHEATGSLVVLTGGIPQNSEYRRFRIQTRQIPNDVAMIKEVVKRRMKHPEWQTPDLLVVDGGKPQVKTATQAMRETLVTQEIPVIGLAKRLEEIVLWRNGEFKTIRLALTSPAIHVLQRIRDEAHRFARKYHHLLRSKRLFDTING